MSAVIGGMALVLGAVVVVRAVVPPHVTLTVTERQTALADGGSGSWRGYVTDERGRRWEMSAETYGRLGKGDRVVCATGSWTYADEPWLSGRLADCRPVQASD